MSEECSESPCSPTSLAGRLTKTRLLTRNSVVNLCGEVLPLLVAVAAIPFLIDGLGTDRFGVLTLTWVVLGYFGLFDLGIGRALTQVVASRFGDEETSEISVLVWTGMVMMGLLGIAGAAVVIFLSPWFVRDLLNVSARLEVEAISAFRVLGASIPVVITNSGFRGVLHARQNFGLTNAVSVPRRIFTFLGPLAVLPFSRSLVPVVAVLAAGQVLAWIAYLLILRHVVPSLCREPVVRRSAVQTLLSLGGWMTVSNVVSPIMVYLDRFLIGALVTMTGVAYYTTPYEIVTKLWFVQRGILGVLFPAFSTTATGDPGRLRSIFGGGSKSIGLLLFPVVLAIVALAPEALDLWLGAEFARNSAGILRWLAVGVFVSSVVSASFALIQAVGRPDLTAKAHMAELPLYLFMLLGFVHFFGVIGAAVAWTLRVTVDGAVMLLVASRVAPAVSDLVRETAFLLIGALAILGVAAFVPSLGVRVLLMVVVLVSCVPIVWTRVLSGDERSWILRWWNEMKVSMSIDAD